MSEFVLIELTIPAEHRDSANRCAAVFDFDTGGINTFGRVGLSATGGVPVTHYWTNTAIKPDYIPLLKDPVQAMAALTALATQYGRDLPVQADVEAFCAGVIVGPTELVRVVTEQL